MNEQSERARRCFQASGHAPMPGVGSALREDALISSHMFKVNERVSFLHSQPGNEAKAGSLLVSLLNARFFFFCFFFPEEAGGFSDNQGAAPLDCGIKKKNKKNKKPQNGDNVVPFPQAQRDSNNQLWSVKRAGVAAPTPRRRV